MINVAICDDEIDMIYDLEKKITDYMIQNKIAYDLSKFICGESLLASSQDFDIILLDIKMNGMGGIEAAKKLRQNGDKSHLIFITALKEYVFDAFEVSAANYLVKPINTQKLYSTLDRIFKSIELEKDAFLEVHQAQYFKKIRFADILYAEVFNHTVILHTTSGTEKYSGKIEDLEKRLDANFYRCHRSYLVNFSFVQGYRDSFAVVTNNEAIPVAKRRQQEFFQALLQYQRKEVR